MSCVSRRHNGGSNVVITIQDDGRGLDPGDSGQSDRKRLSPDATLSERSSINLIFLPGFSTAQQGDERLRSRRGHGRGEAPVRIVARLRSALRAPRPGTTLHADVAITLAIIEGLLVEIGQDQFIVPMSAVTENVELSRGPSVAEQRP